MTTEDENLHSLLSEDLARNDTVMYNSICLPSLLNWKVCYFALLFQSVVGDPLPLTMVPLRHTKTQLRELRYSSSVIQGLSQLGRWGQCVEQMEDGALTLPLLCAQVWYFKHGPNVIWLVYTPCGAFPSQPSSINLFSLTRHLPLPTHNQTCEPCANWVLVVQNGL